MAIDHRLQKLFGNFKGLDKRSSDLNRDSEFATEIKNAVYRSSGAISKRKGYHGIAGNKEGGHGLVSYKNVNSTTGAITEELICVDSGGLKKLDTSKFLNITFEKGECSIDPTTHTTKSACEGAGGTWSPSNAWYTMYLDPTLKTFQFKILLEGVYVLEKDLGTGFESSPYTLLTLSTDIAAMSNFATTLDSSLNSLSAAFLEPVGLTEITNINLKYNKWSDIDKGDTDANYFSAYAGTCSVNPTTHTNQAACEGAGGDWTNNSLGDVELENASFAQLNNVLYISNGYDELIKYDGVRYYRAGLPQPVSYTATPSQLGNNHNYSYKIVYEYTDDKGNKITSEAKQVDVKTNNVITSGYAVTIAAPNLQSGGWDLASSNLKIKIYRSADGGTIFYYLTTLTNNTGAATQSYTDSTEDGDFTALTETLADPIKKHSLPPKGKYITTFQDCLVIAGQRENVNNVQYSLPYNAASLEIGSEYFPDDDNAAIVESSFGDKITSIAPLKDVLYIFHENSIHTLSGDIKALSGVSYKIDLLTTEGGIGCKAHATVQEYKSNLFFLSENGIYSINNSNGYPEEISAPIQPEFKKLNSYTKQKSLSFNWVKENVMLFAIPLEISNGTALATSSAKIFAYDTNKNAWLEWNNIECSGGIALLDNKVYFSTRSAHSSANLIESQLYIMQDTGSTYDYTDHASPINFVYKTNWESLGEPTVPKKFLRLKMYAMDSDETFESSSFILDVKVQRNYVRDDIGTISMDFAGISGGGWGVAQWGSSSWGSSVLQGLKTKLPSGKTRSLLLNFENKTINENVLISGYELEIATPYRLEIKE